MKKLIQILADISIGIYFIWVGVQLCLLIYFENTLIHKQNFWPFRPLHYEQTQKATDGSIITISQLPISSYDVTEFIFYILFPLVLAFAIMFIIRKKTKQKNYFNNWILNSRIKSCNTFIFDVLGNEIAQHFCEDKSVSLWRNCSR